MKKRRIPVFIFGIVVVLAMAIYFFAARPPSELILTGIVTTDTIIVSPEIQGRLQQVLVREGNVVTNGELIAVIQPQTQKAEMGFYSNTEQASASQVNQADADLKFEEAQTSNQIAQAEANLASAKAQSDQTAADLEFARQTFKRQQSLHKTGAESAQVYDQARTSYDAAQARWQSSTQQVQAAQSAVALAKSRAEQVASRDAALNASKHQLAAARAQKEKAEAQLSRTEIFAPTNGIIDTRVALPGEVVNPGQAIVTLINPDDLWVRVDVEESYIDNKHLRLGEKLRVTLPSGETREGTVFYRGVDADYATQRDVSRTKRDIKTFEVRLRVDNQDRRLAVGMTAYAALPLK